MKKPRCDRSRFASQAEYEECLEQQRERRSGTGVQQPFYGPVSGTYQEDDEDGSGD